MEEPTHVILRCPNGHDLRVASTDIGKPLSCPICNTVFQTGASGADVPATVGYAGYQQLLGGPVEKPSYTTALLVLWFVVECFSIVNSFLSTNSSLAGCVIGLVALAAVVLQLTWIYRIHQDAARSRGYRAVTPGTALGLSFIPYFNLIWTGWTLKKLAEFHAQITGTPDQTDTPEIAAGRLCFYAGIVKVIIAIFGFIFGTFIAVDAMNQIGNPATISAEDFDPFANASTGFWILLAIMNMISFACLLVYIWSVRRIEPALYSALTTTRSQPEDSSAPSEPAAPPF